jgi:hypothetical protein
MEGDTIEKNDYKTYNELSLEKIPIALDEYVSREQMLNFEIEKVADDVYDYIIYKFKGFLMGEKLREEKKNWKVSYPATWWQMFREQYFPKWWVAKFPIRYIIKKRNVTFKVYELYPKLPIVIPKYTDKHFPIQFCYTEDKGDIK